MISPRRRLFRVFAGLACGFALSGGARAANPAFSDYPSRPIVMVVPFAAGGPTDIVARLVARGLSRALDQQVNIENIVGAGGTIAANRVRRADPDGYTIMMGHLGTHAAVTGTLLRSLRSRHGFHCDRPSGLFTRCRRRKGRSAAEDLIGIWNLRERPSGRYGPRWGRLGFVRLLR